MNKLVLITGAGASRLLSQDPEKPLPLMQDWATELSLRLGRYAERLGIVSEMPGEDFERRLGDFLCATAAVPHLEGLPWLGLADPLDDDTPSRNWFKHAHVAADEIGRMVHSSLHDLFATSRIGITSATKAYGSVIEPFKPHRLVYATTNYDVAGELALAELGRRPYAGLDHDLRSRRHSALHAADITSGDTNRTPVLYLHGRVGWYQGGEGIIATNPDAPFDAALGSPALLLPDPAKSYDDDVPRAIWEQFEATLTDADRVLVIGHSLNDTALVQALKRVAPSKLAVTIYAEPGWEMRHWQTDQDRVLALFEEGAPHVIPMHFGPDVSAERTRFGDFVKGNGASHNNSSTVTLLGG